LPAPTEPYDVPIWTDCKVGLDQFAAVAKSLYSFPFALRRHKLRARADSQLASSYAMSGSRETSSRTSPDTKRRRVGPLQGQWSASPTWAKPMVSLASSSLGQEEMRRKC
jgi:hypothetical protein